MLIIFKLVNIQFFRWISKKNLLIQFVINTHKELLQIEKGSDQLKQIENMIKMARQTWTLQFSRFYQMIAVSRDSQYLIKNNSNVVIMAVNWAGIFIVSNESEQILQVPDNVIFN